MRIKPDILDVTCRYNTHLSGKVEQEVPCAAMEGSPPLDRVNPKKKGGINKSWSY
jgi:hypothetical protein